jgi:hypothetical protein
MCMFHATLTMKHAKIIVATSNLISRNIKKKHLEKSSQDAFVYGACNNKTLLLQHSQGRHRNTWNLLLQNESNMAGTRQHCMWSSWPWAAGRHGGGGGGWEPLGRELARRPELLRTS